MFANVGPLFTNANSYFGNSGSCFANAELSLCVYAHHVG